MIINRQYDYKILEKVTLPTGTRYYVCPETNLKLPSVTTILDKVGGEKKELLEWIKRVGVKESERIKKEALGLGTLMHTHLENYIMGIPRPGGNNLVRIQAEKMSDQIINNGLINVDEVYGCEAMLYVPGLYAGSCDGIARYKGKLAIIDFKSAKKIRKKEMIDSYFEQVCAYGLAHDHLFGTNINTAVIFMVDRDYNFKEFVIEGDEFNKKTEKWLNSVDTYYSMIKE